MEIPLISAIFKPKVKEDDLRIQPVIYNKTIAEADTKEGKAFIGKKGGFSVSTIDSEEQNVRNIDKFYNAYHNFPIVAASIDSQVEQVVQDFRIEGPQKDALMKWSEQIKLKHHLRRICRGGLIGGTYWAELVSITNGKGLGRMSKPVSFKHLDSRTMRIDRTKKGKFMDAHTAFK